MEIQEKRIQYSFENFVTLMETLLAEDKTTGDNHSEAYLEYTRMNLRRMRRIHKTAKMLPETEAAMKSITGNYTWLVITEAWCGDAAQNLPALQRISELSPNVKLEIVLRDQNLDLMDQHLTNGGRSIPKLLMIDDSTGKVVATWGPRPAPAQQLAADYKKMDPKPAYSEFTKDIQKWYAGDKTLSLQAEFITLVSKL